MTKHIALSLVMIACLSFSVNCHASIVIDNFNDGDRLIQFGEGSLSDTTNSAGILGGERHTTITVRELAGQEFLGIVDFDNGLAMAQGSNDQIFGSFLYDGFSNVDFTQGGINNMLRFDLTGVDSLSPVTDVFSVAVTSGGVTSNVQFDLPGSSGIPAFVDVYFDEFSGVDFTSVDSVSLSYDFATSPGTDVAFGSFSVTVPEPSTIAMIAFGCTSLMFRRRRRA